jgi:PAS domain S-box-containing protein
VNHPKPKLNIKNDLEKLRWEFYLNSDFLPLLLSVGDIVNLLFMRILIVEDDELVANALVNVLTQHSYAVEVAADGEMGWELADAFAFDLIVLDVMLPRLNGLDLCRRLRSRGFQMPILLLTGRDRGHDKVAGLDAGADDYIVKPFDPEELHARIRALLRRSGVTTQPVLEWSGLRLDPSNCEVTYHGTLLSLTPKEYGLLELFLRNSRRVFSCSTILEHLWSFEETPGEEAVRTHIKGLRQKLKAVDAPSDLIDTVYGIGYRLKPLDEDKREREQEQLNPQPQTPNPKPSTAIPNSPNHKTLTAIANVWERFKPRIREQVAVLERVVVAITEQSTTPDLVQQAQTEAHTLAGSLGTFGLPEGSRLAREIEQILKHPRLKKKDLPQLSSLVTALRQQIETVPSPVSSPASPASPPSPASPLPTPSAHIMVVDDDPSTLEAVHTLLDPWGLHLTMLADSQQFWPVLEETGPDLLILDLHMPSPNGLELCQTLRESDRWNSLPVMVLTAHTDVATVNQVFSVGADDFVSKPLVGPELVTRIINRLERVRLLRRLSAEKVTGGTGGKGKGLEFQIPEDNRFFNLSLDLLGILGLDGYLKRVNLAFERTLGYTSEELLARPLLEFVHLDDRAKTTAELERWATGKATLDFESRYRCKDGSYCWLSWRSTPVVEEGLVYGIARDITERKRQEEKWRKSHDEIELRVAERTAELVSLNHRLQWELDIAQRLKEERDRVNMALRFSQARFSGILEIASDAIISINANQCITLFNQGAEKIFGYMAEEVLGQPLDILLPVAAIAAHRRHVAEFGSSASHARRMGERALIFGQHKDGTEFPCEASISRLELGEETVFTVILRDITERKKAEDALQQSEERLRLLLDGVEDYAIFMLDPDGYVESWNPGAERIHSYRSEQIIGQHCSCLYVSEDVQSSKPAVFLAEAALTGRHEAEGWRVRTDGSRFFADTVITALRDSQGNLRGFSEITRDITTAKQREAERLAVERMKDEFVSVVSHELRTPLTSIHGSLGMLASGLLSLDSDRGKRLLQIAADSTERLVRLINDILDIERIESGKVEMVKQPCNVADLMIEATDGMESIADANGITLSVSPINVEIHADCDRILQTFTNLLSNAIKFSPSGSTVRVSAQFIDNGERENQEIQTPNPQPQTISTPTLRFSVQDEGRGIPSDKLESIFERFQQVDASDSRHHDGTGLGLTICRSIIHQHGGRIWVESEVGKGSTFYFTLPLT